MIGLKRESSGVILPALIKIESNITFKQIIANWKTIYTIINMPCVAAVVVNRHWPAAALPAAVDHLECH